jgi:hypothetical protein
MKFARYVFLIAGIYGLLVFVPQYFVEAAGVAPTIALPDFFYGFLGVAVAFQFVFIILTFAMLYSFNKWSVQWISVQII